MKLSQAIIRCAQRLKSDEENYRQRTLSKFWSLCQRIQSVGRLINPGNGIGNSSWSVLDQDTGYCQVPGGALGKL
jgi:hypothetical protein